MSASQAPPPQRRQVCRHQPSVWHSYHRSACVDAHVLFNSKSDCAAWRAGHGIHSTLLAREFTANDTRFIGGHLRIRAAHTQVTARALHGCL
jgi:hypothetical protein|eukprot:SAG25_NODE_402_length_8471_cov_23.612757_3_plen_92_part_00